MRTSMIMLAMLAGGVTATTSAALAQPPVNVKPDTKATAKPSPAKPAKDPGKEGVKEPGKDAATSEMPKALVAFPHPLITEVNYAVASGPGGDANRDGTRDANGDEFVELVNPHDKPINLKGYTISGKGATSTPAGADAEPAGADQNAGSKGGAGGSAAQPGERPRGNPGRMQDRAKGNDAAKANDKRQGQQGGASKGQSKTKSGDYRQVTFTFPDIELKPGQVVVVFNGHGATWKGPVGDSKRAPEKGNPNFHGAMVFTMGVASDRLGFSNRADYVLLSAPDGKAVETVKWGDIKEPADHGWLDEVPSISQSSVQRRGMTGGFEPHDDFEGQRSSPGVFPLPEPAPASAPAPAADPAKPTAKPGSDAPK